MSDGFRLCRPARALSARSARRDKPEAHYKRCILCSLTASSYGTLVDAALLCIGVLNAVRRRSGRAADQVDAHASRATPRPLRWAASRQGTSSGLLAIGGRPYCFRTMLSWAKPAASAATGSVAASKAPVAAVVSAGAAGPPAYTQRRASHHAQAELRANRRAGDDVGDVRGAVVAVIASRVTDQTVGEVLQAARDAGDVVRLEKGHVNQRGNLAKDGGELVLPAAEVGGLGVVAGHRLGGAQFAGQARRGLDAHDAFGRPTGRRPASPPGPAPRLASCRAGADPND